MYNNLLTEEDIEKAEVDMYEQSARFIKTLHATFRKMGYSLADRKKRSAVRVLEAMLFEPLEKVELSGQAEKDLFAICHQIMYHKNKVAEYALKRRMDKENQKGEQS